MSSKNFTAEIEFQDNHFDNLCYRESDDPKARWYQNEDQAYQKEGVVSNDHWTQAMINPCHNLQDEVARIVE